MGIGSTRIAVIFRFILAASFAVAGAFTAHAQNYPSRVITFVVPSTAGGPGDASARLIIDSISKILGQQIVIENVPGAGGTIGMARVARAAPDGYTLMIHQNGFAITPALYPKLPFDTERDFVTVGLVNRSHSFLVSRKSLPAKNFAELALWLKSAGNAARVAHPGMGSLGHLQTNMLMRAVGADANLIPYRGIAPAVNDLVGEHIDVAQVGAAVSTPQIKAGNLKAYAVGSSHRDPNFPDVPTYGEVGHKELERYFWHALFAPAATPRPILEKLNAALQETLSDPRVLKTYADSVVEPYPKEQWPLDAANAYVRDEVVFWAKVVRESGVKAE